MSYSKDREEFVCSMARMGWPTIRLRELLRYAGICQRVAEVECSVSDMAIRRRMDKAGQEAERRIRTTIEAVNTLPDVSGRAFGVRFGGDPRGCVVALTAVPCLVWGVPARGYRASQMERMARPTGPRAAWRLVMPRRAHTARRQRR